MSDTEAIDEDGRRALPSFGEGGNLAFIHIGKTAGTWLREQLASNFAADECCPHRFHGQFASPQRERERYRFFSAHIGFETADRLAESKIVVLRNPIDRLISLYHYWREVSDPRPRSGPTLAKRHKLAEMASLPEPSVIVDFRNSQVWQLAAGHDMATRRRMAADLDGKTLLDRAIANLDRVAVVGLVEEMPLLADDLRHELNLTIDSAARPLNVTSKRPSPRDVLDAETLRALAPITALDRRLYQHVLSTRILPRLRSASSR